MKLTFNPALRSILRDSSGGIAATFGLALLPIAILMLFAVDMGRLQSGKNWLMHLSDSAALAAANMDFQKDPEETARDMMMASSKFANQPGSNVDITVEQGIDFRQVTVRASYQKPLLFRFPGMPEFETIVVESVAYEAVRNIEAALVLDISSSMNGSKINDLRASTKDFVESLITHTHEDTTSVSLIPYGGTVNVRPMYPSEDTDHPDWNGCFDMDDSEVKKDLYDVDARTHTPHFWKWNINNPWCPRDSSPVFMNSNDVTALKNAVDAWELSDGTGSDIGAAWGYRALSPNWRHQVGGDFADRPAEWNDPTTLKFLVIMTDGGITAQFRPETFPDPYTRSKKPNETQQYKSSEARNAFAHVCQAAKDNGVTVFTIAYKVKDGWQRNLLEECSGPDNYFNINTGSLQKVFSDIAERMSELRLKS